jgi:protein SCO1/2
MEQDMIFNETSHAKSFGAVLLLVIFFLLVSPGTLPAHTTGDEVLKGVGVDEKLNARVPPDLVFTDLEGKPVRLGGYFTGQPVILTLNYYTCPMLCPLIFRNLTDTIQKMRGLSLNRDYRIVTVSIDPDEKLATMREKARETHSGLHGVSDPAQRWPFLMGTARNIQLLTSTVGFRYVRVEKDNFAHPSVFIVLTPDGRIARYLYGIELSPQDLKLALIEAADGKIGGSAILNRVLLYCFHYDPAGKKYAVAAVNLMKIAGGAILAMLVILIAVLIRSEKRKPEGRKGS